MREVTVPGLRSRLYLDKIAPYSSEKGFPWFYIGLRMPVL